MIQKGSLVRLSERSSDTPELLRGHYGTVVDIWDNGYDQEGYVVRVFLAVPALTVKVSAYSVEELASDASARLQYVVSHWLSNTDTLLERYRQARQRMTDATMQSDLPQTLRAYLAVFAYPSALALSMNQEVAEGGLTRENVEEIWQQIRSASQETAQALFDYVGL